MKSYFAFLQEFFCPTLFYFGTISATKFWLSLTTVLHVLWFLPLILSSAYRFLHWLALAGDLLLCPARADDGLYVLHAGDTPVPALPGQEEGGRGGTALPARPWRPHPVGVCTHRRRLRRTGWCDLSGGMFAACRRLTACIVSVFSQGSRFQITDLKDPGVYKPLVIGFMLMVFQQMTGINAIMFYAQNIFEQAHFKVNTVYHSMTITIFVWGRDGYHIRTFFPALGYRTFCFPWLK